MIPGRSRPRQVRSRPMRGGKRAHRSGHGFVFYRRFDNPARLPLFQEVLCGCSATSCSDCFRDHSHRRVTPMTLLALYKRRTCGVPRLVWLVVLVGIVAGTGLRWAYLKRLDAQEVQHTYALARSLGYTDAAALQLEKPCQIFTNDCFVILSFITDTPFDAFRAAVDQFGYTQISSGDIDSSVLNITPALRANGKTKFDDYHTLPTAPAWHRKLDDGTGHEVQVYYYGIADQPDDYAFNGRPIHGNVAKVVYGTKRKWLLQLLGE